jgi:hypothetical protein
MTRYVISIDDSFYDDGTRPTTIFNSMGWVGGEDCCPTSYPSRESAAAIIGHWFNHNNHPDYVVDTKTSTLVKKYRYTTVQGKAVGEFLRVIDDTTKKAKLIQNPGPFPVIVEFEDSWSSKPGWAEL